MPSDRFYGGKNIRKKSIENIEKLFSQAQSMVGDKIPGMGGAAAEAPAEGGEVPAEVRLHLHPHLRAEYFWQQARVAQVLPVADYLKYPRVWHVLVVFVYHIKRDQLLGDRLQEYVDAQAPIGQDDQRF